MLASEKETGKEVYEEGEEMNSTPEAVESQERETTRYRTERGRMPRQWLIDRCDSTSFQVQYRFASSMSSLLGPFSCEVPDCLEQNCLCEKFGRLGCVHPEGKKARRFLFTATLSTNVIGLLLLIVDSFSIADENFYILWNISFTKVWVELISAPQDYGEKLAPYRLGLRAAAFESFFRDNSTGVLSFDAFCDAFIRPA